MQATTDTDYGVVRQPPEGLAERQFFKQQLTEADFLELPLISVKDLMREVGGSEVNTQDPYKIVETGEASAASMDEDDDEATSTGGTTSGRDNDNRKKASLSNDERSEGERADDDAVSTGDNSKSEYERSEGEQAYDDEFYPDSDGVQFRNERRRSVRDSESDGSASRDEIDITEYSKEELIALLRSGTRAKGTQQNRQSQESDSQVRRGDNSLASNLSRSRSGSLSFEPDLSPGKQKENEAADPGDEKRTIPYTPLIFFEREKTPNPTATSEEKARAAEEPAGVKPPGRKENVGIPTPTKTSSAPSSGKSGQANEPARAETEGTPSPQPAQEAGTSSGSSRPG